MQPPDVTSDTTPVVRGNSRAQQHAQSVRLTGQVQPLTDEGTRAAQGKVSAKIQQLLNTLKVSTSSFHFFFLLLFSSSFFFFKLHFLGRNWILLLLYETYILFYS